MWKLLVHISLTGSNGGNQQRVYVFEFNGETAARNAAEFYKDHNTFVKVIPDPK